ALLLSQGNNGRTVRAQIVAHAGAESPSFGQLIGYVQFECTSLESLELGPLIAFAHQVQACRQRQPERAAELLGVLERRLSGCRISGADVLFIEVELTVVTLEDVVKSDADVGAVGPRLGVGGRQVGALESESAVIGLQRCGDETLAPAR